MTTLIGFDFGLKHIGVAVGQTLTRTATPLTSLKAKDGIPKWPEIQKLLQNWAPQLIVVGIPLNMDGSEQLLTFCAKGFVKRLKTHTDIPIQLVDERLSSFEAKDRILKGKTYDRQNKKLLADINAMSAAILVEEWLSTVI